MKLQSIRLFNFQSFANEPTVITFEDVTYLIGPNGSGKTAVLQALCRLFAFDPSLRRIKRSDFHVPADEDLVPEERSLWLEADFEFPELLEDEDNSTVAPHFAHMRLDTADGIARVRYRLSATMGIDGDIEENLVYVLDIDKDANPLSTAVVTRAHRNTIQMHYLPARRDPADHITYGANALLGRLLRAVNWEDDRERIKGLTDEISECLSGNQSVSAFSESLNVMWKRLHKGTFFTDPKLTFVTSEIESLLRHMSVSFSPGHDENLVDFSRLSDGQKSMLYLSLVLSSHAIGRAVLTGNDVSFDADKLKPPSFTLIAVEEPENSLSPHYLGRIVNALNSSIGGADSQAIIATHAPSMLRRVAPENIRYLRLAASRATKVTCIALPDKEDEAHKFVREAVQAFPEVYFSRLVVLGEGDSEEIVLPRILQAKGAPVDESAVTIAPLGGRHVNHFWRLLSALETPYVTLLDLDVARYQGGWGRVSNIKNQLVKFSPDKILPDVKLAKWNDDHPVRTHHWIEGGKVSLFAELEKRNVFFSEPMDLDFAMLIAYPDAYDVSPSDPDESTFKAVLGKNHHNADQYDADEQQLFGTYHSKFKLNSKPAAHISALAKLTDEELLDNLPPSLNRMADAIIAALEDIPE
jgi:energy-coupling factor transporter ATP-binding protein EcfA2